MTLPALVILFILAGLYLRESRTSAALRSNEQLARECMRDAMANRDELFVELCEERKKAYEMQLELGAYRGEEQRREEFRRVLGRQFAN